MGGKITKLTAGITNTVRKVESAANTVGNLVTSVVNVVEHPSLLKQSVTKIADGISNTFHNIETGIQQKGFVGFVEDAAKSYYHKRGILGIAMDVGFVASLFLTGGTSSVAGMVGFAGETLGFIEEAEALIGFGTKAAGYLEEAGILGSVQQSISVANTISDLHDGWSLANNLSEAIDSASKIEQHYNNLVSTDPLYKDYKKQSDKTQRPIQDNSSNVYDYSKNKQQSHQTGYTKPMVPPKNTYMKTGQIASDRPTNMKRTYSSYY